MAKRRVAKKQAPKLRRSCGAMAAHMMLLEQYPSFRANQLRLWMASMAYVLLHALRRIGLAGTRLATATCGSIRLKLLKIGAFVQLSVRRVKFSIASAFPYTDVFAKAWAALDKAAP